MALKTATGGEKTYELSELEKIVPVLMTTPVEVIVLLEKLAGQKSGIES
jgi:hypothetical protein